jgi:hypothetical protein
MHLYFSDDESIRRSTAVVFAEKVKENKGDRSECLITRSTCQSPSPGPHGIDHMYVREQYPSPSPGQCSAFVFFLLTTPQVSAQVV